MIDTLEAYERDYGCTQFYAVDLIMPRGFEKTVFPEVARRGHDWTIFFEVKSNMKHEDVVSMRCGGVKSIQPGIESLDDDVLRIMRKGVTAAQNIQMLRWARELGMSVDWNILVGFPGESPEHYLNQIDLLPSLFHLAPADRHRPVRTAPLQSLFRPTRRTRRADPRSRSTVQGGLSAGARRSRPIGLPVRVRAHGGAGRAA